MEDTNKRKRIILAITGASGSVYGIRVMSQLLQQSCEVHLIISKNGRSVLKHETNLSEAELIKDAQSIAKLKNSVLIIHDEHDLFACVASGSFKTEGMAVVPCSMSTLGGIACGTLGTLIGRAADVCLKERRKLVVVPRETPLSTIHLKNMLTLSEAGATILPAMPAFYNKPDDINDIINFVIGRIMSSLGFADNINREWKGV